MTGNGHGSKLERKKNAKTKGLLSKSVWCQIHTWTQSISQGSLPFLMFKPLKLIDCITQCISCVDLLMPSATISIISCWALILFFFLPSFQSATHPRYPNGDLTLVTVTTSSHRMWLFDLQVIKEKNISQLFLTTNNIEMQIYRKMTLLKVGVSRDEIWWELQLIRFAPFNGNTLKITIWRKFLKYRFCFA